MKQLKTKVIMSAFVLLFALVATIGSTYAWFTVSNEVAVSNIDLDVITADSLLIQVQDSASDTEALGQELTHDTYSNATTGYFPNGLDDFQSNITTADFVGTQYAGYQDYLMTNMTVASTPTTGAGYTDYTALDLTALGTINLAGSDRTLTGALANQTGSTGGYIEFNFWLVYSGENTGVQIALQDLAVSGITGSAAISEALAFGVIGDNGGTTNVYSLDPDYAFEFGSTDAGYLGTGTPSYDSIPESDRTVLKGLHSLYYGASNVQYVSSDSILVGDGATAATTVATLEPDIPELITFRVWIEGWDFDATNALSATDFSISFGFIIKTPVA